MKRFLIHTILFAILVSLALLAGEYLISIQPNPYKIKHQYLTEKPHNVDCLILGSSHAFYGIKPEYISQKAFNCANISQNFEYDNILLRKYAPNMPNLKTVIVPISYFSFFDKNFEQGEEPERITDYKKYMDVNIYPDYSKYNFELSNMSIYSGKLKCVFKDQILIECDSLGFGLGYDVERRSPTWDIEDAHKAVKRHTAADMSMLEYNYTHLCHILDYCKERSIRAILITTPTYHEYYDNLNGNQLNKMYEIIDSVVGKYDIEYHDYLRDNRFYDDDFYDGDHLSSVGAIKFSQILNLDLEIR